MSDQTADSDIAEVSDDLPAGPDAATGVVMKWRRRGEMLEGLVSRETDGRVFTEWLPALVLSTGRPLAATEGSATS
jgi:hypothetical protein